MNRRWLSAVIGLSLLSTPAASQVLLDTDPTPVARGALIRLGVTPAVPRPVTGLTGELAGEALHFRSSDGVRWTTLAGIPVEGGDTVPVTLVLYSPGRADTVVARLLVQQPDYPLEQLTVAPRMAEPDSAAQVRIAGEVAQAREVSRRSHDLPQQWDLPFVRPRPTRVTSAFGTGRTFNGKVLSRHMGTDFAGQVGTPIVASNRGRVALVAQFYLSGNVVYLDHGAGIVSAYFHLSRTLVKTGDLVERGQVIGRVGQTGRVTGPHLHWVMRYGRTTVDPMSVLRLLGEEKGEK